MIKYFELLLSLLDISNTKYYIQAANKIEANLDKDLVCYHKQSFIFEGYKKLLNDEITTEEFTQLGDIYSSIFFDTKKEDSISFLKSNPILDDNKLYIFDKISHGLIEVSDNAFYC